MNKYEIAVVLNALIEDSDRSSLIDQIKSLIERFGGTVTDTEGGEKRSLAYEIKKMKEGYYYFIHFTGSKDVPSNVEDRIRIIDNVLRYLVVSVEE